jgi:uncharacterized protein YwqG
MSKQQTAVEWLLENMPEDYMASIPYELAEQALQMNREQIEQAFIKGNEFVPKWKINGVPYIESEQYYEQTYGTTKSH